MRGDFPREIRDDLRMRRRDVEPLTGIFCQVVQQRWIMGRTDNGIAPGELRDLNYLAHAACNARVPDVAATLLRMLGRRATRTPWSYTGDPDQQFVRWRKELKLRG